MLSVRDLIVNALRVQFLRFLFVGGVNTLFGYAVFALFIFLGLHYSVAIFLATVIGVLFNFFTYGRFVFFDRRFRLIVRFVLVYVVYYLVYVTGLAALTRWGLNEYAAGALLALPVALVAFTLNKKFVFVKKTVGDDSSNGGPVNIKTRKLALLLAENRRLFTYFRVLFVVLALGWLAYALFAHGIVESMYKGEAPGFLNRAITDQSIFPVEHYLEKADVLFVLLNVYVIMVIVLVAAVFVDRNTKTGTRAAFFVLGACLLCAMFFVKPVLFGDAPGYFMVTESMFNHLTPDLREGDIESLEALQDKHDFPVLQRNIHETYFFEANDGKQYSCHFWAYPLLNLPVKAVMRLFHADESRVFQITNAIILILALCAITFAASLTELQKRLFILLVVFSPAFWFIYWPHTEVFSFSFVVISLVYTGKRNWRAAVFCAALAATQNPPIVFMVVFLWLVGILSSKRKWREVVYLSLLAVPAGGPYLFSLLKYGRLSLYAAKSTGTQYMSVYKAMELFFDLNIGMLPYIPVALILFFGVVVRDVWSKRRLTVNLQLLLLLFVMMFACTPSALWNHGTSGPSRYVIWMLPIVFYVVVAGAGGQKPARSWYASLLWIAIAVQAVIVFGGGGFTSNLNHTRHTAAAAFVLDHFPSLYNPTHEIFAARTTHRIVPIETSEEFGFVVGEHATPVVYRYKGKCKKALVKGKDLKALEEMCGYVPASKKAFFENGDNLEKTTYVNY